MWTTCSCCGSGIEDTPEANVMHGVEPCPTDEGGMCVPCADWSAHITFDPIIEKIKGSLNPENSIKFKNMSFTGQCDFALRMVEKGVIKFQIGGDTD